MDEGIADSRGYLRGPTHRDLAVDQASVFHRLARGDLELLRACCRSKVQLSVRIEEQPGGGSV
ncbi:Uncharacterised protein [Mycobacterium tuberculosis]|uniref:Uncharacterized protein n=1 Tax=Mycobacterium tuberculosis TaxID=1773 RepID=A0A654U1H8_MYCTX|nr:Uncharacterised protein [Mycobacterium tuberculosis]CKU05010.1 Uncharacterised protein [Mycobacterium tuberculosis]CKV49043.1 Uncharacterised protein [Mycobacterium tuberculosis]COY28631.1 Uncharacterised protein [Mycobacterium tuberculosis]